MSRHRGFVVTRQSNYYDDGAYSVEIARELDYAGPGALSAKYPGEFEEFDDPRDAAEAAIQIRSRWIDSMSSAAYMLPREWFREDPDRHIGFTLAMNDMVYATVNDAMSASELRRWARKVYDKLPKCAYCSQLATEQYSSCYEYDEEWFCGEHHAELYFAPMGVEDDD